MMPSADDATRCDARTGSCHLCGDEAVAGRVVAVDPTDRVAVVEFASGTAIVALDLVEVTAGDAVLVHLGFAIERMERA